MEADMITDVFRQMLFGVTLSVLVIILPGVIVGLLVSIFQAATQINESTLSFLPKLFVMFITLALLGPWLLQMLVDYTRDLLLSMPHFIA